MIDLIVQNPDIIHHVLTFLVNDGTSVARFALSSKALYDRIMRHETFDPNLWKDLVYHRWKRTRRRPAIGGSIRVDGNKSEDKGTMLLSYRNLYIEKRRADAEGIRRLEEMASVLQTILQLNETRKTVADGNPHIGQAWEHHRWNLMLRNRADFYDILKSTAGRHLDNASSSIHDRLLGFLAARCVQDFHFADCLLEWKGLTENISEEPALRTRVSQLKAAYVLEKHALLVCEIQKTPCELLEDNSFHICSNNAIHDENSFETKQTITKNSRGTKSLDEIARACRDRMHEELEANASVTAKLKVVNDVLVNYYGFSGNSEDYYNYRNVLLDYVLESKTGMPLTLCLVYSCVCRRLGIAVQLTGLPGHIVLGFDTNDETNATTERRSFVDVFHGCRILSTDQCRQIVASYGIGWSEDFLAPLSTKMTLQRIFNNLRNCHEKAMSQSKPPKFCSDLMFQQHALGMVNRYPPEIATTLLERLTQDLSIILSPDLLRAYNLLSPRGLGRDPVINGTHARTLLELSSYVGLSYHNYA
jgi:regulator of sirC expression with transglutaminase-like and TPR domain